MFIVSCEGITDLYDKVNGPIFKIVVGDWSAGGYIWISYDGGETWTRKASGLGWGVISSSRDGLKLVATPADAGSAGYIYNSLDGGSTWAQHPIGTISQNWKTTSSSFNGSVFYLACYDAGSQIFRSADSGATWAAINGITPPTNGWGDIVSSSDGNRIETVTSTLAELYTYTFKFDGISWSSIPHNVGVSFARDTIASSADGQRLITGDQNGNIYISTDGGAVWTLQASVSGSRKISVTSSDNGMKLFAVELTSGYIWRSPDGGLTWIRCDAAGNRDWMKIAASPDGMHIAAGVLNGYIYTSADGGVTWIERRGINNGNTVIGNGIVVTDW